MNGIDISHHNFKIITTKDIKKHDFVIMKATEGKNFTDPRMRYYYSIIHGKNNFKPDCYAQYGFYHFASPENNTPISEAKNFLNEVKAHSGYALFALDWEGNALKHSPSWALKWCDYVYEKTGTKPIVYIQSSELKKEKYDKLFKKYGIWVAHWGVKEPKTYGKKYTIWQKGILNGIDYNVFNGNQYNWNKLVGRQKELLNNIYVNDYVKVLTRVDYNGVLNDSWVLNSVFKVSQIKGQRVVISKNNIVTGAWHINDLKLVNIK